MCWKVKYRRFLHLVLHPTRGRYICTCNHLSQTYIYIYIHICTCLTDEAGWISKMTSLQWLQEMPLNIQGLMCRYWLAELQVTFRQADKLNVRLASRTIPAIYLVFTAPPQYGTGRYPHTSPRPPHPQGGGMHRHMHITYIYILYTFAHTHTT